MMSDTNNNNKNKTSMDSRVLASLLSSLVSELILLVLLFLFPNTPDTTPSPSSTLFPLIFSEIVTSLSLLPSSKKRKRSSSEQEDQAESNHRSHSASSFSSPGEPPPVPSPCIDSFKVCFRMSSSSFEWLTGLLEPLLECRDPLGSPLNLPAEIRLGIGLFRLATGSDYSAVASRFNVSEATSRFCTKQLCRVLCTNFRFWVAFPNSTELESVSRSFEEISGFPNCCGVIDCTRFKIKRQNFREETVVAQIVVDSSSRILNIVAGFRGDKNDSSVLKCSSLYNDIKENKLLSSTPINVEGVTVPQYLIGDGGYPLLPWLMVPFVDPVPDSSEEHFNAKLRKMHLSGFKTFASLRNWGILNKPIEEEYKIGVACIGACSILHNALLTREDYSALSDNSSNDQWSEYCQNSRMEENTEVTTASLIRNALSKKVKEACGQ